MSEVFKTGKIKFHYNRKSLRSVEPGFLFTCLFAFLVYKIRIKYPSAIYLNSDDTE